MQYCSSCSKPITSTMDRVWVNNSIFCLHCQAQNDFRQWLIMRRLHKAIKEILTKTEIIEENEIKRHI